MKVVYTGSVTVELSTVEVAQIERALVQYDDKTVANWDLWQQFEDLVKGKTAE